MADSDGKDPVVHEPVPEPRTGRVARKGAIAFARELQVPYTRLYNAMSEAGVANVETKDEQEKVVVVLLRSALSLKSLSRFFGGRTTLSHLAALEARINKLDFEPDLLPTT